MGWSVRRIARETGHRRETIARYGNEAGLISQPATQGKVPTDSPMEKGSVAPDEGQLEDAKAATADKLPTDSKTPNTLSTRSSCEEHRSFIEAETNQGRNAKAIYQDLVEHHGYIGAYDAVKRFVRALEPAHESYVKCRFETPPGQEAQVDYGEGALTLNPNGNGRYRRPRLFVMTLGMSRHAFRKVVWQSSTRTWCELHEEAFAYFGGTPKMLRLDNLREGVIDPDIYDPELNELYADMLKHYGVIAMPCRPYAPDLKGKVESSVGHTQKTPLKSKRFHSIEEQNTFLMHWNERWAATRIHGTTKRQVREMFEEERPHLTPLPNIRFPYYQRLERVVHLDGHIEVGGAYYSVPARWVGSKVIVQAGSLWLRIIDPHARQCIREHTIAPKGSRRTVDEDRPKQTPIAVHKIIERIATSGPSCGAFARELEVQEGALATRKLFGVLDLIRRHGAANVDRACGVAVRIGAFRLRFLRTYLASTSKPEPLTERHPLIEAIATYRSHFETLKQGESDDDS